MGRIDDLLERLRGEMPDVPNAESSTDRIMATIDGTGRKNRTTVPLWIVVTRAVSTAAAAAMLAWLVYVTEPDRTAVVQETPVLNEVQAISDLPHTEYTVAGMYSRPNGSRRQRHMIETIKQQLYEKPGN